MGGGNSAVEAALTLSEQNRVSLSYRGNKFSALFQVEVEPVQDCVQRQVHRLQRMLAQLSGGHRRDELCSEAGGSRQPAHLLHRLRHLCDGLSPGCAFFRPPGANHPATKKRRIDFPGDCLIPPRPATSGEWTSLPGYHKNKRNHNPYGFKPSTSQGSSGPRFLWFFVFFTTHAFRLIDRVI